MKKLISAIFGLAPIIAICACGDSSSASKDDNNAPDEVLNKKELLQIECNADIIGKTVYVKKTKENYECDGEKWFKDKSSSSQGDDDAEDEDNSSSSSTKESKYSSNRTSDVDSRTDENNNDDDNDDGEISSKSKSSSSSSRPTSYADAKVMPAGTYDCAEYDCVSTSYLNQEMLAAGEYGEVFDERAGKVYRTVNIGDRDWIAQTVDSIVYITDENDSLCPPGWRVPYGGEWLALEYHHAAESMTPREWLAALQSTNNNLNISPETDVEATNISGFSALLSINIMGPGMYSYGSIYYDSWIHCETTNLHTFDEINKFDDCEDYSASLRCISDVIIDKRCHTDNVDTCKYGKFVDERDGNEYSTVEINGIVWMNELLKYTDSVATKSLVGQTKCIDYSGRATDNDSDCEYIEYTMAAAFDSLRTGCGYKKECSDAQGICPDGWRVPNEYDRHRTVEYIISHTPKSEFTASIDSFFGYKALHISTIYRNLVGTNYGSEYPYGFSELDTHKYPNIKRGALRCVKDADK